MSLDERVSDLIRRIYCAAEDPRMWDQVVHDVLDFTGAHAALTTVVNLQLGEFCSKNFYGSEETAVARGLEEYGELYHDDPTLIWAAKNPTARFCDSRQTLAADEYLSNAYLRWQRDRLRTDHWFVGYTRPDRDRSFSFSLLFPVDRDSGRANSIQLFRMLFDHMDAAVQLGKKPFDLQAGEVSVLLDCEGRVSLVSQQAMKLISASSGLDIRDRRLTVSRSDEQTALDNAIGQTARVLATGISPRAVKISRPSGARPWIAIVRPDFRTFPGFGRTYCGSMVEFRDSSPPSVSAHLLQTFFGLTEKEAELLQMLNEGHSIQSLANHMAISPNTARVHLHSVFSKTSTTRQSELLQLCGRLAAI